jgi:hypothetical protein
MNEVLIMQLIGKPLIFEEFGKAITSTDDITVKDA